MWLIGRCERRRDTAESHGRRRLYEERVTILYGLHSALASEVENWRIAACRSLATLPDISDDENSPNHSPINVFSRACCFACKLGVFLQTLVIKARGFPAPVQTSW